MVEWLARIPGPRFLFEFLLLSIACTVVCWMHVRMGGLEFSLPDKNKVDPIKFAVLRGGWQAVIDVVVIQLIERNIIGIEEQSGEKKIFAKQQPNSLSALEAVIFEYVKIPKSMIAFQGKEIKNAVEDCLRPVYRELERLHLWKTDSELQWGKWITYLTIFCLEFIAMTKAHLGLIHHKPVGFLIALILLVPILMLLILRPGKRVTGLGKQYMKAVVTHFSWMKEILSKTLQNDSSAMRYALGAAIFGVGILAADEIFSDYKVFAQSRYGLTPNGNFDGGSGGSGCSGSGCGGSGCGGGGCGGCGS